MYAKSLLAPCAALACALGAVPQASAQDTPFSEVIDVRVVNLEAVVVDKNNIRVQGLSPEDFQLKVDGKVVEISYFTEILGGVAVARRGTDGEPIAVPSLEPGEPVGTNFLVFIDNFFSLKVERDVVLQGLIEQLPLLRPNDRMAVVTYDGRQMEMLTTWNGSAFALERALRRALDTKTTGQQRAAEYRLMDAQQVSGIDSQFQGRSAQFDLTVGETQAVQRLHGDLQRVVTAASSALRGFAEPRGRRVMILLSGGWPADPVKWVVRQPERAAIAAQDMTTNLYNPLWDTANRLGYTLYPVDVAGMQSNENTARAGGFGTVALTSDAQILREREVEFTLIRSAIETGGEYYLDGDRLTALGRAVEDTLSYYWLGFTPEWKGNDKSHDVKLTLRDKSLSLRTRESFKDLSRQAEVNMVVESALLFGDPPTSEPLMVTPGRPESGGRNKIIVPLTILIPVNTLTFLPYENGFVADTELRVAVMDEAGNKNEMPVIPLRLQLDEMPKEGDSRRFETAVKIRDQKHSLVVALFDYASGKILSTRIEITPG